MAICPNEHMHFLLHALKTQDRESVTVYLAELLLWLVIPSNPLPALRIASITENAMEAAQETLREKAQSLRALMRIDPSLARTFEDEAAEQEAVADALQSMCRDTEFFVVTP